jgi:uroporphyrinogen-III synthase
MSEVLIMNARTLKPQPWPTEGVEVALLNHVAAAISSSASLESVLNEVVELVTALVKCDSFCVYLLEEGDLVLRASKSLQRSHASRPKIRLGEKITRWVTEHRQPLAVSQRASDDPRLKMFSDAPEERFESFLSVPMVSGGRLLGVINLQNCSPYEFSAHEIALTSTVGFMIASEVERARLETENAKLQARIENRKLVERAKGVLQREMRLSESDAYRTLQRESMDRRKSMKEIAEAVLLTDTLKRRAG